MVLELFAVVNQAAAFRVGEDGGGGTEAAVADRGEPECGGGETEANHGTLAMETTSDHCGKGSLGTASP